MPPQTFDSPRQMDYAEHLSFTPWHSLPEHRPIGGVNRIRKTVYEQISTLRHNANGKPRREPAGVRGLHVMAKMLVIGSLDLSGAGPRHVPQGAGVGNRRSEPSPAERLPQRARPAGRAGRIRTAQGEGRGSEDAHHGLRDRHVAPDTRLRHHPEIAMSRTGRAWRHQGSRCLRPFSRPTSSSSSAAPTAPNARRTGRASPRSRSCRSRPSVARPPASSTRN